MSDPQRWITALSAFALLAGGCSRPAAVTDQAKPRTPADASTSQLLETAAAAPSIELTPVGPDDYDRLVADRRGQVVLVDFWATWCAPCIKQLSHTAQIAKERKGDGLAVITVAMEDPEDADQLKAMLAARDATGATNLVSKEGGGSPAMAAFEIAGGSLPHYKLYDRTGQLRQTFELDPSAETQFTTDDIDAAVEKLLAE